MGLKINKAKVKEVKCSHCNVINEKKLPISSGNMTFFCRNCGEEIHLVFDRMVLELGLKHRRT